MDDEQELSPTQKTASVLLEILNIVEPDLTFTEETKKILSVKGSQL